MNWDYRIEPPEPRVVMVCGHIERDHGQDPEDDCRECRHIAAMLHREDL